MSALNSIFNILRFNKKNWKAVVLSLAAATVFWFFNSLNKTYTTSISFPLEFEYNQDNFIPVTDMPTEVKINVTGLGWTLLRRSAGVKVPPLLLPLERPNEVKKIVGSTLPVFFESQLSDLQINFVANDTLRLDIEPLDGRWLSLTIPDLTNNLEAGFGLASSVSITPDSIFVHGPRRIVESLPEPHALKLARTGIDESIEIPLQVSFDNDRLTVDPQYVNVSFRVEEVVEIRDSVRLELRNIPTRLRPAVSVKEIRYTMLLPVSVLHSSYSREAIKATLDLKNHSGKKSKLAPTISGIPPLARIIRIDTVEVSN
jgi:hypothetical protein